MTKVILQSAWYEWISIVGTLLGALTATVTVLVWLKSLSATNPRFRVGGSYFANSICILLGAFFLNRGFTCYAGLYPRLNELEHVIYLSCSVLPYIVMAYAGVGSEFRYYALSYSIMLSVFMAWATPALFVFGGAFIIGWIWLCLFKADHEFNLSELPRFLGILLIWTGLAYYFKPLSWNEKLSLQCKTILLSEQRRLSLYRAAEEQLLVPIGVRKDGNHFAFDENGANHRALDVLAQNNFLTVAKEATVYRVRFRPEKGEQIVSWICERAVSNAELHEIFGQLVGLVGPTGFNSRAGYHRMRLHEHFPILCGTGCCR